MTHAISDFYIHGYKPNWVNPSYPKDKSYFKYKGIDPNNLAQHITAELMVDCIAYYEKDGKPPSKWGELYFYVDSIMIREAIRDYKYTYGGDFSIPSVDEINTEFEHL